MVDIGMLEDLRGTRAVTARFVVTNRRVVIKTSFLEQDCGLRTEVKPVHPNADLMTCSRDVLNPFALITARCAVAPCIDAVDSDLSICDKQLLQVIRDIGQSVARGALFFCSTLRINAGVPFCRNNEEGRREVLFQREVSIELVPKVFGESSE